jgi:hypothetical protein
MIPISENNIINISQTMSASKYVGLTTEVDINSNYEFNYDFSVDVGIEGNNNGKIY